MKDQEDKLITKLLSQEYHYDDVLELYDRLDSGNNTKEFKTILEYLGKNPKIDKKSERSYLKCLKGIDRYKRRSSYGLWVLSGCIAVLVAVLTMSVFGMTRRQETLIKYVSGDAIARIVLPDGTKVTMAKGSTIVCPEAFKGKERRVQLTGKAFFDVVHNKSVPFVVDAEDASVLVTGTRFDMVNDNEKQIVSATLVDGSISFTIDEETVDVVPGEQVLFNKKTKILARSKVDVTKETRWIEDVLRYRSVTLSELIEDLSANFKYTIILDPSLNDIVISGSFRSDYSITDILEILKSCLEIEYKISKNAVFIFKSK